MLTERTEKKLVKSTTWITCGLPLVLLALIKHFPSVTAGRHDKDLQIQAVVNKYPRLEGNLWVQGVSGERKTKQPLRVFRLLLISL